MCSNNWPLKTTSLKGTNLPNCKCIWGGARDMNMVNKTTISWPAGFISGSFYFFGTSLLILGRKLLISCEVSAVRGLSWWDDMRWKHLSEKWSPRKLIWNFPSDIRLTREFSPWRFLPKKNRFCPLRWWKRTASRDLLPCQFECLCCFD